MIQRLYGHVSLAARCAPFVGMLALLLVVGCGDNLPARQGSSNGESDAATGDADGSGGTSGAGPDGAAGDGGAGVAGRDGGAGTGGTGAAGTDGGVIDTGVDAVPEGGLAGTSGAGGVGGAGGMGGEGGVDAGAPEAGPPDAGAPDGAGGGTGGIDGGVDGTAGAGGAGGTSIGPVGCDGTDCTLPGGKLGICLNDLCGACATDAICHDVYGAAFLCIGGACVTGGCHTNTDCLGGQLCDTTANTCVACNDDTSCVTAFGADHLCVAGACAAGNCRSGADCGGGFVCDTTTSFCGPCASDNACLSSYGSGHLCVGSQCVVGDCRTASNCSDGRVCNGNTCTDCSTDQSCAGQYGAGHLCVSGGCVAGECRTASDCDPGQLCDATFTCTGCSSDNACLSGYGANHLCVSGLCVAGDCRTTADCGGGRICNTATFTCSACSTDSSCVTNYGADHLCVGGNCISGTCRAATDCSAGEVCDANTFTCTTCPSDAACLAGYGPDHLCLAGACAVGQCRSSPECANGGLCDTSSHQCRTCSTDPECVAGYGMNHLCVGGACVSGTCHTTAECGGGQICNPTTFSCEACANDAACVSAYGAGHLCEANVCIVGTCRASADCGGGKLCDTPTHACVTCANDSACQGDASYGTSTFCLAGACTPGDCRDTNDCPSGQLCGTSAANTCGACGTDAQCTGDSTYGSGNICFQGICQQGDCHGTSADCTGGSGGLVCGAVAANRCGACASDQQCQEDPTYGSSTICNTAPATATTGQCVSAACSVSGACPANGGDFCCSSLCVPGNCCADTDCLGNPAFGVGYACVNNHCTGCSAATGNKYLVDPVNGNDATATGSGLIGSVTNANCSFKTVTRALQVAGGFAVAGTQIVIVGAAGQTVSLATSEAMPILVPANVTITTRAGPILVTLPASVDPSLSNVAGFQLGGDLSAIAPDPAAPLTIDGSSNTSGIGIGASPGAGKAASLSYVTVQNTGGHGLTVTDGTFNIGQGVTVKSAGTTAKRRDGLNVTNGTVRIAVVAGQAPTSFLNNTQHGIYVTGTGVLNVTGVPVTSPAPNGQGTVVTSGNFSAGVRIFEAPGAAASSLNGLVAWANPSTGLRIYGGSKLTVRNSVFLANGANGVFVTSYDGTASGNDLSRIDLGTSADPGHNYLQALLGSNPDVTGLCVSMAAGMGSLTLHAAGDVFAGPTDCSALLVPGTPLLRAPTCSGFVDVGVVASLGTTVTVDAAGCN
jgi:hypothetical protein